MPIQLCQDYGSYSATCVDLSGMEIVSPGTNPSSLMIPKFMSQAIEMQQIWENELEKPRPDGLSEDLILELSLSILFIAEVMKHVWFTSVKEGEEMFSTQIKKLKRDIGISPIYESVFMVRESGGTKYKPVAKKVVPVSAQDPGAAIPAYKEIKVSNLCELPVQPKRMEDLRFTERLTKERVSSIISKVPAGFLTKAEAELLIHILFRYERAIVFTDLECRTFSQNYYPDNVIRMVPHQPWQKKPIRLLQSRCEEVM